MNKKNTALFAFPFLAFAAFALDVEPEIRDLQFVQNDNRMVTISYTLTQDAVLSMDLKTNGVSI